MSNKLLSFEIITKELAGLVSLCNNISPKKSEIDLFTHTKVEFLQNQIKLSSTNGSIFYAGSLKISSLEANPENNFLIKTDVLANVLNLIKDETITINLNLEKLTLQIVGAKSKNQLRISVDSIGDFVLPALNKEKINCRLQSKASDILESNKAAFIAVGLPKNVYQPEFLNLCYTVLPNTNNLIIVSTDRFRISRNQIETEYLYISPENSQKEKINYLIPPKTLHFLASAIDEKKEILEIIFEENYIYFELNNSLLIARYGDGVYPDYERIIPKTFECNIEINTADFINGIKQVLWCLRTDVYKSVSLNFNPTEKTLTFNSRNSEGDTGEYGIGLINYEGSIENWSQAYNAQYLLDYINLLKTETFNWECNIGKPSVLSPKDLKQKQIYLCSGLK